MKSTTTLVAALTLLVASCTGHSSVGVRSLDLGTGAGGLEPGDFPSQRILRARYQGPAGQGSFRLVLRLAAEDRYQVSTSDLFGRPLWTVEVRGLSLRFVDFRSRRGCRADEILQLEGAGLDSFPLQEIAAVLLGRLPGGLQKASEGPGFRDSRGRLWTLLRDRAEMVGWTLWEEEQPLVWLQYRDGHGILSHRQGSQLRWRQILVEDLDALESFQTPPDFMLVDCLEIGLTESELLGGGEN